MKGIAEPVHATRFGMMRLLSAVALFFVCISGAPGEVRGQTPGCKELVAEMAAQQKTIGLFRSLDYGIRTHFLIVANAMLGTYGGWNSKPDAWGNDTGKLRDSRDSFELEAFDVRRDMNRSDAMSEDEVHRLTGDIDGYLELIETGSRIARAIGEGKVDEANTIYFETARPLYRQVHGDLYTLIITAERRVASMARTPCS